MWLSRPRRPAAPAGQRHAGRERQVPAAGGDGEAGGEEGAGGGEGTLLLLRIHAAARRGQSLANKHQAGGSGPAECGLLTVSCVCCQEEEMSMLGEITHLQTLTDDLKMLTVDPHKLPAASEQVATAAMPV